MCTFSYLFTGSFFVYKTQTPCYRLRRNFEKIDWTLILERTPEASAGGLGSVGL